MATQLFCVMAALLFCYGTSFCAEDLITLKTLRQIAKEKARIPHAPIGDGHDDLRLFLLDLYAPIRDKIIEANPVETLFSVGPMKDELRDEQINTDCQPEDEDSILSVDATGFVITNERIMPERLSQNEENILFASGEIQKWSVNCTSKSYTAILKAGHLGEVLLAKRIAVRSNNGRIRIVNKMVRYALVKCNDATDEIKWVVVK